MRVIQAGILVCLMAITGLLFAIYRQQAVMTAAPEPVEQAELLAEGAVEPVEVAAVQAPQPPADVAPPSPRPKPRPAVHKSLTAQESKPSPAPKPAPAPKPVREPAPQPTPVKPAPVAESPAPVQPAAEPEEALEPEPEEPAVAAEESRFAEPLIEEPAPEPREPRVVMIPAGERLTVRIDNTLSTSRNRADDTFFASLDEQLIVDGLIIADKGARLQGRIVEAQQAGRVKGLARLVCELTHLETDDGQRVEIRTSVFALDGPRTRGKDMKQVAMGAGAGAILGAIFGGGKGAAIGAASGAGAGAGAAAATRGEPAVIEPETRLDFRLTDAVTITEKL